MPCRYLFKEVYGKISKIGGEVRGEIQNGEKTRSLRKRFVRSGIWDYPVVGRGALERRYQCNKAEWGAWVLPPGCGEQKCRQGMADMAREEDLVAGRRPQGEMMGSGLWVKGGEVDKAW